MEILPVSMAAFKSGFNPLLSGYAGGLGAESQCGWQYYACLALLLQHVLHYC